MRISPFRLSEIVGLYDEGGRGTVWRGEEVCDE